MKNTLWYSIINSEKFTQRYKYVSLRLIYKKKLSKTLYLLEFRILGSINEPIPPQFMMLWVPSYEAIPMSIALFDYENKILSIIVKPVGETTNYLISADIGTYMGMYGFLGKPCVPPGRKYLLIGGGSGIAPIIYYVEYFSKHSNDKIIDVIYGCWNYEDIGEVPSLIQKYNSSNVKTVCLSDLCDYRGTLTDALNIIDLGSYDSIIISGPNELFKNIFRKRILDSDVLSKTFFIIEKIVKCGVGFCGKCVIEGINKLLCIDGPCFPAKELYSFYV